MPSPATVILTRIGNGGQIEAVIVQHILVFVRAVGNLADQAAEADPGPLDQLGHRAVHRLLAEAGQGLVITRRPEAERGQLRPDVAHHRVGLARVGADDRDQRLVHLAGIHETHRRDQQPFLVELGGKRRRAARQHAADIDLMGVAAAETADLALPEIRHHENEVGRMRAAIVGVVEDEDVALAHLRRSGCA